MDHKDYFSEVFLRNDVDGAFRELVGYSKALGFPLVTYSSFNLVNEDRTPMIFQTNYPEHWIKQYTTKDYIQIDPLVRTPSNISAPIIWSRITNLSAPQKEFMKDAAQHGLVDGITYPLSGPGGTKFFMSFAGPSKFMTDTTPFRNLAAMYHLGMMSVVPIGSNFAVERLSERQIQILELFSNGKTYKQISSIIGISQAAISDAFNEIRNTLGVDSNVEAAIVSSRNSITFGIKSFYL